MNIDASKKVEQRFIDNLFNDMKEIIPFLDDETVTNISILDSGEIVVDRFAQKRFFSGIICDEATVRRIIYATASILERQIDLQEGFAKFEGIIPRYNARIQGLLPPSVLRPQVSIRKPPSVIYSIEEFVEQGRLSIDFYNIIIEHIENRKNILIGGGTGSGKTTFLNAIIKKMEELTPDHNFYIVEDVPEIQCRASLKTMICVNPKHAAEAVRSALRMFPDRIIFGEVRYGEVANELYKAWNTGHEGNATTIHADNCISMLTRFKSLLREVIIGELPNITEGIHLCIHLQKTKNGPVVDEVLSTAGIETESFIEALEMHNLA